MLGCCTHIRLKYFAVPEMEQSYDFLDVVDVIP